MGVTTVAFVDPRDRRVFPLPIHVGNGEKQSVARQIFGKGLADEVWEISRRNMELAGVLMGAKESSLSWWEKKNGGSYQIEAQERSLLISEPIENSIRSAMVKRITKEGPLRFATELQVDGETIRVMSDVVILLSDRLAIELLPNIRDKLVPVTLSSFMFPKATREPIGYSVFNNGIDFAIGAGDFLRLGSYRNLFEDRAVGFHAAADEITRKSILSFFSGLKWIAADATSETNLSIESISCDGLPIVGPLPDLPGVYAVGGFSARPLNFAFAVAESLAGKLSGKPGGLSLDRFSTKRFV